MKTVSVPLLLHIPTYNWIICIDTKKHDDCLWLNDYWNIKHLWLMLISDSNLQFIIIVKMKLLIIMSLLNASDKMLKEIKQLAATNCSL